METGALEGKTFLVTGATSGIGLATVRALAAGGGHVVMVGHRPEHDREVVAEVKRPIDDPHVDYLTADLANQADVRRLAGAFEKTYGHLDVLINDVGGYFNQSQITPDGHERTFALNHLNTLLLTLLLWETLEASAPARVINVASEAHRNGRLDFDDLETKRKYAPFRAYSRSKAAMIMATYELARRTEGSGVTVNVMHPGFVASRFFRPLGILAPLVKLFARTPEEGADTVIYLATSPEVAGVSGKYYSNRHPLRSAGFTYDQEATGRLWEASLKMIGRWDWVEG